MWKRLRSCSLRHLPAFRIPLRATVPILVLGLLVGVGGARPGEALAGEPVAVDGRPDPAPRLELPEPVVLSQQAQALSGQYRAVYWTLAAGDRAAAIERAAALEVQAFAAEPAKAIEWLTQADGVLLTSFLDQQPACALPLALFYERLVLAHAAHQRFRLTHRAMQVADRIFERMALGALDEAERRLTADGYAAFASGLLTVPAPARAAEVLDRGGAFAPEDDDIQIALAILLLRDRRAEAAEERLDHVLRTHPDNREARLRRALMRAGVSADGRAGRELEKLATGGENDWIALVAAQERFRRLLATGDYSKSIEFLNRVLERFPDDSSLRVALAFASARSGRRAEAFLASKAALQTKAAAGEGARRRFAELPIRLLAAQTKRAEAAAEGRISSLAAALSSTAPAPPGASTVPSSSASTPAGVAR